MDSLHDEVAIDSSDCVALRVISSGAVDIVSAPSQKKIDNSIPLSYAVIDVDSIVSVFVVLFLVFEVIFQLPPTLDKIDT